MTQTTRPPSAARERILETASQLFYQYGFHAVGIDTIVAESGIAKMTLYRHFASKDQLIVAYLEHTNRQFWGWLEGAIAHHTQPRAQLLGIFQAVDGLTGSPQCLGCTFQAAASEFPVLEHQAHQVALAHKEAVRARFHELASQAGLHTPEILANQLLMLMDGAWVAVRMFGHNHPANAVAPAAAILINAHAPGTP